MIRSRDGVDGIYLKGVDLAIINTDSLEEYKAQVPQIQQRIVSIMNLFPSDLHIFVRPEVRSLADLAGKTALEARVPARTWKLVSLWGVLVLAVLLLVGMAMRLWRQMGGKSGEDE